LLFFPLQMSKVHDVFFFYLVQHCIIFNSFIITIRVLITRRVIFTWWLCLANNWWHSSSGVINTFGCMAVSGSSSSTAGLARLERLEV